MKKLLKNVVVLMMLVGMLAAFAIAEEADSVTVYVTISDGTGKLVMSQEAVTVTDSDADGALTINDALFAAHEAKYEGGAAKGYLAYSSEFGLSLSKLWGEDNGGSYGYYLNNASAWSLTDEVKANDYVNAYVYTDLTTWSDTYSFFDKNTASAKGGEPVELTLSMAGYDENWNPVTLPVEGAIITIDGVASVYKTDAEGKVSITLDEGSHVISAVSETVTLVPPVCVAEIEAVDSGDADSSDNTNGSNDSQPETGDEAELALLVVCAMTAFAGIVVVNSKKKSNYEK